MAIDEKLEEEEITPVEGVHFNPLYSPPAITADRLKEETPIDLPDPLVDDENYQGIVNGGTATIDNINGVNAADDTEAPNNLEDLFTQYLGSSTAPPSGADIYENVYGVGPTQAEITTKKEAKAAAKKEFDLVNAEIQAINAEAKAIPIRLQEEAKGRGITAGGLQPIETSRLRNLALRSLPLEGRMLAAQAELTNSSEMLRIAQGKFDKVFELRLNDATNQYNYNKDLRQKVYDFATTQEQARIDALQREDDQKFTLLQIDIQNANSLATTALNNGQADIASQITALDPSSATYKQELANLQAQIVPEGFNYVSTPLERDQLKARGYQIIQRGEKTFAKAPELTEIETYEAKKKIDEKYDDGDKVSISDQLAAKEAGYDIDENGNLIKEGSAGTYTDGSGAVNNVAGWAANDASKVASMQQTADMIGQVTDENIDVKVAEFTPGVTADMIKTASEEFGVSWESIMTQIAQESIGGTSNVALKNNNFAGITASSTNASWYEQFNGSVGTARPAAEGGNYVKFATKQDGVDALANLQASFNSRVTDTVDGGYPDNIEFKYNEKIDTNALPDIGKKAITDKSARMSNLPFGITAEQANWIMERRPGNIEFQRLKTKDYDSLAALLELREDITQIRDLKTKVRTGSLVGPLQFLQAKTPYGDTADFSTLLTKTGKNLADYVKSISGAAVSEEEAQRLSKNIPNVRMQDGAFDVSFIDFADDYQNLLDAKLTQYGIENEESLRDAVLGNRDYNNSLEGDDSLRAKYNYGD